MAKFNAEHKKDMSGNYFGEGVHKVTIGEVKHDTTTDKEFFSFVLLGENDEEGEARLWFHTDKAMGYSFNVIRSIFVHNAPEAAKDATRNKIDAVEDTESLAKACQMLVGKKCWYQVEKDPNRKYIAADGTEKSSYNKNIYGYEPKPKVGGQGTSESAPVQDAPHPADDANLPAGF